MDKKHVQNLERLLQKLQSRYGGEDDLVLQLKHDLRRSGPNASKDSVMSNHDQDKYSMRSHLAGSAQP